MLARQNCTYRAVEHAFPIHGNVKATLHALDGHHSQTHRNKIKQSCRKRARVAVQPLNDSSQRGQSRTFEF